LFVDFVNNIRLISLLGTSGQNLDDIDLQSTIDNRVQILENCLNWGVIAPTCPDTLSKIKIFI
jgi:DNA polymerase II small subunit/DNA polymerase delta subunit B